MTVVFCKRDLDTDMCAQREDHATTEGRLPPTSHGEASEEINVADNLILDYQPPGL